MESLKVSFPGMPLMILYNMMLRFASLELKHPEHPEIDAEIKDTEQVNIINAVLKGLS